MENSKNRFNRGTAVGKKILERSLRELGCGRSVLADKNGEIIAGNDVYASAVAIGKKIVTIETDGDVLVVVKRTDVSANEKKGMELALVDNLSQEKNLDWDADALLAAMQTKLSFDPKSWGGHACLVKELDLRELLRDDVQIKEKSKKSSKKDEEPSEYVQLSLFE